MNDPHCLVLAQGLHCLTFLSLPPPLAPPPPIHMHSCFYFSVSLFTLAPVLGHPKVNLKGKGLPFSKLTLYLPGPKRQVLGACACPVTTRGQTTVLEDLGIP